MSPDVGSSADPASFSTWHSIRPWNPPLSLTVREITSVSATFILSSAVSNAPSEFDNSLASLGLEDEADNAHFEEGTSNGDSGSRKSSIISDALAKGLSVNVNGSPWQRVFIRIDDKVDEAVIIIYGLMPGRHYDITLALVQAGQTSTLQRQVTTEDDADTSSIPTEPDSPAFDQGPSDDHAQSTLSTSPSHTIASTPPNAPQQPTFTLEDRLAQLKHTLHIINTERESLVISLKSSRRESQKADAALRSEIDILKRASEKHIAGEHRSKQKILALQEAVKQAQNATRETEERAKEVEELLPSLAEEREQVEAEWRRMKAEADRSRGEKDQEEERCKKRMEGMKSELVGLSQRLDRLNGRRDKLEGSIVPELEEKLKEVEREVERAERATSRRGSGGGGNGGVFDMDEVVMDADHPLSPNFLPMQRRQQSFGSGPGLIGRPVPIQRPYEGYGPSPAAQWNAIPRQAQVHNHNHNPRASSLHQQTPTVLANPQRRGSLKSSPSITNSNSSNSNLPSTPNKNASTPTHTSDSSPTHTAHSSASGSPTAPHAPPPPITSTLSSRAPSFEPGRGIGSGKGKKGSHTNGNGNAPVPTMIMQRPPGGPRSLSGKQGVTGPNDVRWAGIHEPSYDSGRR